MCTVSNPASSIARSSASGSSRSCVSCAVERGPARVVDECRRQLVVVALEMREHEIPSAPAVGEAVNQYERRPGATAVQGGEGGCAEGSCGFRLVSSRLADRRPGRAVPPQRAESERFAHNAGSDSLPGSERPVKRADGLSLSGEAVRDTGGGSKWSFRLLVWRRVRKLRGRTYPTASPEGRALVALLVDVRNRSLSGTFSHREWERRAPPVVLCAAVWRMVRVQRE